MPTLDATFDLEKSLEYQLAKRRTVQYSDAVKQQYYEAMQIACDRVLELGISAFEWICNTENVVRQAVYDGLLEWNEEYNKAFRFLYLAWLGPCPMADKRVEQVLKTGHRPENLERFEEVRELVKDRLESQQWFDITRKNRLELFNSEPW